uniref:Uncharacterized protein n=1 Tax=Glossina morsitans morsitans TaxID=37546 RepID=A0A1B0FFR4_GLOMM
MARGEIPYATLFHTVIHIRIFLNRALYGESSNKWTDPYNIQ